ncbi:MAG: OmpH family outer membrane protein [Brumimicrobium sp.]
MKNLGFKLLLGLATTFVFTACGDKESTNNNEKSQKQVDKRQLGNDTTGIAIAYYLQDSIATQFNFYREIDSMLKAEEMNFQKELETKIRKYRQYEENIQKRMDAGEITGYELDEIQQSAMEKQQAIQQFEQQKGAELQQESLQYQTALMNKIAEAGREFSNEKGIDLLYFYQKGGQITYISDAFDVTEDFIDFLNKREEELKSGFDDEVEAMEDEDINPALQQ